jgi:UDP-N-acetylmuramoylalanine--D-glutamate ligase
MNEPFIAGDSDRRATDLSSRRVVVMGLGRFGGGVGLTRFLVERGARVLVTDLLPAVQLRESCDQIRDLDVEMRLGEHRESDFAEADLVVVNPAVDPRDNPFIIAARHAGVPCTSEIRLLTANLPNHRHTIGITGTAGKSTVAAMTGHILSKALGQAKTYVGGNIGGSLLGELDRIDVDDWVVLELSSFMLEGLAEDRWSPHVAVVTNAFANHMDRYDDLEAYVAAKRAILDYQTCEDVAILDHSVADWPGAARRIVVDVDVPERRLLIPGQHNQRNAALAEHAAGQALTTSQDLSRSLEDFRGLPHRLEFVLERDGVRYFNDSKSTTPQAAMLAIGSFDAHCVHVVLGGYDKGGDLDALANCAGQHCRAIYTIGRTGPEIAKLCLSSAGQASVVASEALAQAVRAARQGARSGDVVLLSPGCASWDQFDNFVQRGEAFVAAVSG